MPANLSPEYKKAEAEFKRAREPRERLRWLREMLRTVPKHKGTEHLQADIKTRLKQLTEEVAGPRKGGARTGPTYSIRPEGAAQVALIGPPNAGKSTLHARLTGSHAEAAPYPYTTKAPLPGMLPHQDVHFQLVDLPPVSADFMEPWYSNALRPADAAMLVVDLSDPECVDHVMAILERLDQKKVTLDEQWPGAAVGDEASAAACGEETGPPEEGADDVPDPFRIRLPALFVANKSDLDPDPDEVRVLEELLGVCFPAVAVSAETGAGLDQIGPQLFEGLGIVRVYTKIPGRSADTQRPYTVRRGDTVLDVARLVHKEIAESLKFARVWGSGQFDGQQVGADHPVLDGDVVELHG
ncbi:MAG: TGS domain-containing protein [Deltaproteobacteria bacterium]|nr:TGS domain-containing protein [Deltaproteobacteria bacterium]